MGMAASQARLLSITARIHDVEYQAQAIENAKLQLATQSDEVYRDYVAALDATTLTVLKMDTAGNKSNVAATFNNLCSVNKVQTANGVNYALFDSRGKLIVEDDVAKGYSEFKESEMAHLGAYGFAMYMMGIKEEYQGTDTEGKSDAYGIYDAELNAYNGIENKSTNLKSLYESTLKILQTVDDNAKNIYDANGFNQGATDEQKASYQASLEAFRNALYKSNSEEIYNNASEELCSVGENNPKDYDQNMFNHYVSIYNQIEAAGGIVPISEFDDPLGSGNIAANNNEWLQAMIACGKITIGKVETKSSDGSVTFNTTSTSSDDVISETTTSSIDATALAKAEAKYEHDMKNIDRKDKAFDMSLSKLETEREALKTQYEATKKVISDNVERTFGIFGK